MGAVGAAWIERCQIATSLSLSAPERRLSQALFGANRICRESAKSKCAQERWEALLNQLQLAEDLFPKQVYKLENMTAQHFFIQLLIFTWHVRR